MLDRIELVKRKMDEVLDQLCKVSWMFSTRPGKDFFEEPEAFFPKDCFIFVSYGRRNPDN